MINYKLLTVYFILFNLGSIATAQQSTNTSGGNVFSSSGSVMYSVGQPTTIFSSAEEVGSVSAGVQQTYDINTLSSTDAELLSPILIYPNPTSDHITLDLLKNLSKDLSYSLFDIQGRLLMRGELTERQNYLNTEDLPAAVYMLRVENVGNRSSKIFKIIKK